MPIIMILIKNSINILKGRLRQSAILGEWMKKNFVWLWGLLLVPRNYDNQVPAHFGQKYEPKLAKNQ